MFVRFWNWLTGNQKVDVNLNIKIEDLQKFINVLSQFSNKQVIINSKDKQEMTQNNKYIPETKPQTRKKLDDDPLSSNEIASIMLSDGIQKAKDKTGKDVVSASEGASTDDTVSSLKRLRGGTKKDV